MDIGLPLAARQINRSQNTVKRYESLGLIVPARDRLGRRVYNESNQARLREIAATRKVGRPRKGKARQ